MCVPRIITLPWVSYNVTLLPHIYLKLYSRMTLQTACTLSLPGVFYKTLPFSFFIYGVYYKIDLYMGQQKIGDIYQFISDYCYVEGNYCHELPWKYLKILLITIEILTNMDLFLIYSIHIGWYQYKYLFDLYSWYIRGI